MPSKPQALRFIALTGPYYIPEGHRGAHTTYSEGECFEVKNQFKKKIQDVETDYYHCIDSRRHEVDIPILYTESVLFCPWREAVAV
jgi:hypothetical protein